MHSVESEVQKLPLSPVDKEVVVLAARLTLEPHDMRVERLRGLRAQGFSDKQIHAVVMVTACFAFMNRLADGTGVTLQHDRYHLATELFGADALTVHLAWSEGEKSED